MMDPNRHVRIIQALRQKIRGQAEELRRKERAILRQKRRADHHLAQLRQVEQELHELRSYVARHRLVETLEWLDENGERVEPRDMSEVPDASDPASWPQQVKWSES